jgi:hypothetical protein
MISPVKHYKSDSVGRALGKIISKFKEMKDAVSFKHSLKCMNVVFVITGQKFGGLKDLRSQIKYMRIFLGAEYCF